LASSGVAVISTDPAGIVRTFNPAAERLLGYAAAEVVGIATPLRWHDPAEIRQRANELAAASGREVAPEFEVLVGRALDGAPDGGEWTFVCKDGRKVPV